MKHRLLKRAIVMMLTLAMLITSSGMLSFAESLAEGAATDNNDAVATEQAVEEEAVTDEAKEEAAPAAGEQKEEAAPAKESKESKEASSPAFEQSDKVDGVTITVTAEEGTFPEGAKLQVRSATKAEEKKADELVEKARDTEKNVAASYTFDISVVDKDGNELQPADGKKVNVAFKADEMGEDLLTPEVYHIDESGKTPEAEALDVEEKDGEAIAETDGFSTYTIVFSYDGITYSMPEDTITLYDLMHAVGLHGKVYNVVSTDPSKLQVSGGNLPHNNGVDASEISLTALGQIEDNNAVTLTISLFERPDYRITVSRTGAATNHDIKLLHMDGHEVTAENPMRFSELVEVYVTGYSSSQQSQLGYSYFLSGGNNKNYNPGIYKTKATGATSATIIGITKSDAAPFEWTFPRPSQTQTYPRGLVGGNIFTCRAWTGNTANRPLTLQVTVKDSNNNVVATKTFSDLTVNVAKLEKDLADVKRVLKPIILYQNDSTHVANLRTEIARAGIAHFECTASSVSENFSGDTSNYINYNNSNYNATGGAQKGYTSAKFTVSKTSSCDYHGGQSANIDVDVYVLGQPEAEITGNELTISNLNPWCTYKVVQIDEDGNAIDTVAENLSPTLVDPDADDKDKAIDPNNATLTVSNLGVGKYKVIEIIDINFADDQGEASANTVAFADGIDEVTQSHEHDFTYTASGNKITARCTADDCTLADSKVELTLNASDATYAEDTPVTASLAGTSAFNSATGLSVSDSNIEYYQGSTKLDNPPTNAGSYTAKITVEGATAEASFNITRAQAEKPADENKPVIAAVGHDKIKVTNPVEGLRYTLLDEEGVPVQGVAQIIAGTETELVFENLDPNTTYKVGVTTPEDSNHTESGPLISEPDTTDKAPQTAPGEPNASADAKDTISVSGAAAGMKYVFTPAGGGDPITVTIAADGTPTVEPASGFTATFEDGTLTVVGFTPDTAYNVTAAKLGDDTHQESPESAATPVKTAKDAPGATAGAKEGEAGNDGSITNVDETMEYSDDGGATWKPINGTEITGLKAGDYLVHYKAVPADNQPSSASTLVKVEKKASDQAFTSDDKITADAETNKITVTAPVTSTEDPTVYEYRIDGGNWQTSPVFGGLEPGTMHKVEARKAETANSMPSDPIEANVATKALAPSEDKITTTATTLTIEDPESSTLYTVKDGNDNVVAEVKKDKDGNIITVSTADGVTVEIKDDDIDDIVVKGLNEDTTYTVTATKLDNNNDPIPDTESAGTTATTGTHTHEWTYSCTGSKMTATCEGEGDCDITDRKVEMEIKTEKTSYTYGEALQISVDNESAFEDTGAEVSDEIEYYDADGNKLNAAPENAGQYTAKVRVTAAGQDIYPAVAFTITKAKETSPETPNASAPEHNKIVVQNGEQ